MFRLAGLRINLNITEMYHVCTCITRYNNYCTPQDWTTPDRGAHWQRQAQLPHGNSEVLPLLT